MAERRIPYEIYWEILVYCKTTRTFTAIINRCDLNSGTGQDYIMFLCAKGYLSRVTEGEKSRYTTTTGTHPISSCQLPGETAWGPLCPEASCLPLNTAIESRAH